MSIKSKTAVLLTVVVSAGCAHAELATSDVLNKIGFDQHLNAQIPLDLHFLDETGNDAELGDYFHDGKPVVMLFGYYGCPMLCSQILNDLTGSVKTLTLKPGTDFEIVMVSVDGTEGPAAAAEKKKAYSDSVGTGWHLLTGKDAEIETLTRAAGFRYSASRRQYRASQRHCRDHTARRNLSISAWSGFSTARSTPVTGGSIRSQIGALSDQVLLLCYRYDPSTGKYGFAIIQVIRIAGVLTVAALAAFIFFSLRRERRRRAPQAAN